MEMQATQVPQTSSKPTQRKTLSAMRKLTSELDAEVRKVEQAKAKLAKLEKEISVSSLKIKTLTAQLTQAVG